MKTFITFLSFLFSTLAWSGGGVGVGNGRTTYNSPVGFSVSYDARLDLRVFSEHGFAISNAPLVVGPSDVSKIEFQVTKGDVRSYEQLLPYVEGLHPGVSFAPVSFVGARGFFHESRSAAALDGLYYLFTGNYELVRITIHAVPEGNGLELIAPIVHTFSYDETPPEVLGFRVDGPWKAGEVARLYVHARDEGSGIGLREHDIWAELYPVSGPGHMMIFSGKIVPVGNDWYAVEMQLPKLQAPGRYSLGNQFVADQAGNAYYTPMSPFPLEVEVQNPGEYDVTPPRILEFSSAPVLEAGKPAVFYFRVKDRSEIVGNNEVGVGGGDCMVQFRNGNESISVCGNVRPAPEKGVDWYAIEYTPNVFLPEGTYSLDQFGIGDKKGYYTDLFGSGMLSDPNDPQQPKVPSIYVQLKNSGRADTQQPSIRGVRANGPWQAGMPAELLIDATDDVSGLAEKTKDCLSFVRLTGDFTRLEGMFYVCDAKIVRNGPNSYAAQFVVPGRLKAGTYYLEGTLFTDRAGHGTYLHLDDNHTSYNSGRIPRVDITISR